MALPYDPSPPSRLADNPLARMVGYYVILGGATLVLYQLVPDIPGLFSQGRFDQLSAGGSLLTGAGGMTGSIAPTEAAKEAVIAMVSAFLLMVPVAWGYILTRQKRGYQQSLVQTLIILPIVVSGVVILVKGSVALAFSLGGIVGAISFRNRLEDTKDAVQVFLAIGVGLACGVQVVAVALVLSILYNVINLGLWWTDFGRVPADMVGAPAEKRLAKIRAKRGKTDDSFLSQVDSQLLKSMTPEQLQALATKAQKRRRELADEIGLAVTGELRRPVFDGTLRIVTSDAESALVRLAAEEILASQSKYWQLEPATHADPGRQALTYKLRFKKSVPIAALLDAVRRAVGGRATSIDLG